MDEQKIIAANIAAIEALDPELYPELARVLKKNGRYKIRAHLLQIWTYMQAHKLPRETDQYGHGYWSIRVATLIEKYGGHEESWQSHITFLTDIGLLKRIKPDKNTKLKGLREAYEDAKEIKHRSPSFFCVLKYTPKIFKKAEEAARRYKDHSVNLSHITKADVIRVSGSARADMIYGDGRKIGAPEIWARDQLKQVILQRIEEKGYTTWDEIARDVAKTVPDLKHRKALKKCMDKKADICAEAGCQHKPPKKEQRTAYQLEDQRWIITKIKEPPR